MFTIFSASSAIKKLPRQRQFKGGAFLGFVQNA
jgi:hypothetical protein